jgi:TolA-binding protein
MLSNPDVYYLLAYIAYVRKDYLVSQQYLTNMLKGSPQSLFALVSLGHLHVLQKQTEKAIGIYYHAHKLFPKEPQVLIYTGEYWAVQ